MPASWRDQYTYKGYLYLHQPTTVFAALVNQASFSYPLAQVTFDTVSTGAYTDIVPGMTVLFGSSAGDDDLGRGRVRKAATSTILYIGWSSQGTRDGECNLANNAYITVLNDYRVWAKIPRLVDLQTQYKDFDLDYTNGAQTPPVANGGPGVMKLVDSNGEISVNFDGTNSFPTGVGPATITTYAWDFVDGTPASSAASTVNGVTFPYGFRYVALTVTDSNAKTHTTRIPVAAVSTAYPSEISYAGATITSSSELSASYLDDYAFDNDGGTRWLADGNDHWIKIQLASAQTITHYSLNQTSMGTAAADTATLEGSNNDSDWTTIDTRTGLGGAEVQYNWTIADPGSYTYYRLTLTSSGIYVGTWELDLKASSSNVITNFEVTEQTLTREGQIFRVAIHDDIPESTYPDGTLVMYMEREFYNGVEGSLAGPADREHMKFIGWHATDPATIEATEYGPIATGEFECHDILARMRTVPAFSSIVGRIGTSTAWYLLPSAHTDRYIHYMIYWHSTVLEVAPFEWSGTGGTYALPFFATTAANLWEQVSFRAASIAHVLTCSMQGELKILPDPMLQDGGDRTATVITDIDPQDWGGGALTYTHKRTPSVYWLWSSAVVASTAYVSQTGLKVDPVFAVSPGQAPGQGVIDQNQGEWLVVDQDELNARTGHLYARLNAPEGLWDIPLVHAGDVGIDPAKMEWVRLSIASAQAAQRGLTFTDERFLPAQVTITHDHQNGTKEVVLSAERETVGLPAATFIPETGTVVPTTDDPGDWPFIYEDEPTWELHKGASTIAAFDAGSNLHTTTDFNTPEASGGPTWTTTDLTALSPALGGTPLSVVGDPFSPLYLGSGTTVNGWIITTTGIYSITDIFGVSTGPTLALQHTLANSGPDNALIVAGFGVQNWLIASFYYSTAGHGTIAAYTTNGGSTWTEVTITTHYWTGPDVGGRQPPLHISSKTAGLAYAGAYSSSAPADAPGQLYKSTDYGASWSSASTPNTSFNGTNGGTLQFPWHDNASENMLYSTYSDPGTTNILYRTEADGSTLTDVSPATNVAPRKWWALSACPANRQRLACAGEYLVTQGAIYVSQDAGDSWTQVTDTVAAAARFEGVAVAGDDSNVIYAWGAAGQISYTQDFGATWQDKSANLSSSDEIILLIGA